MTQKFGDYDIEFRPLKYSEIALSVDGYSEMLKELNEKYDNPILPTPKTLLNVEYLLDQLYRNGDECYVACLDGIIIAYSLFFENRTVDLKYRIFHGLGLYVEPDYRGLGIGTKLIEITLQKIKAKGVKKFLANFQTENPSSNKVIEKFNFKPMNGTVCLTFF